MGKSKGSKRSNSKSPQKGRNGNNSDGSSADAETPGLNPLDSMDRIHFVYERLREKPSLSGAWIKFGRGGNLIRIDKPDATTDIFNDLQTFSKEDGIFPSILMRMLVSSDGKKIGPGCRASSLCLVACFILCIERRRNVVVPVKERRISESSVGVCWNRIPRRGP